jgi:polygalacturonase
MRRRDLFALPSFALGLALPEIAQASSHPREGIRGLYCVLDYGATGDGKALNTRAIQQAIDACAQAGGGTVYVPPGIYLTGGIVLRSNVTLYLEGGSTLLGSTSMADYPSQGGGHGRPRNVNLSGPHLVFAYRAVNVGISGRGTIDGNGPAFWQPSPLPPKPPEKMYGEALSNDFVPKPGGRPEPMVQFEECSNVRIDGITLKDAPSWTLRPLGCESVVIHGIRLRNAIGPNTDGIDISGSRNVMVSDCDIVTGDDAICLKSESGDGKYGPCANITVTNCVITTSCNGFKIGTETHGSYENIVFSNSVIYSGDGPVYSRVISGIGLNMVDGSIVDGVLVSNIRMKNIRTPIAIRLGTRTPALAGAPPIQMRRVILSGIDAVGQMLTNSITGVPGHPVQDITIENVRLTSVEQGPEAWADNTVKELENSYPQSTIFGRLPAYGFYVRHVQRLRLRGLELVAEKGDARPAIVCDEVEDLILQDLEASAPSGPRAVVVFQNVSRAWVHGCRAPQGSNCFLQVGGASSDGIVLKGNELSGAKSPMQIRSDVSGKDVVVLS